MTPVEEARVKRFCIGVSLVACLMPCRALAAPEAYYNPTTGNITFNSDWAGVEALVLSSTSGLLGNPAQLLDVPGTFKLSDDMPFAFVYLIGNYFEPFGFLDSGNTVVPSAPVADLRFEYLVYHGGWRVGPINVVPESSALMLGGIGLAALALRLRKAVAGSRFFGTRAASAWAMRTDL